MGSLLMTNPDPAYLHRRNSSLKLFTFFPYLYLYVLLLFSPSVVSNFVTAWIAAHQASCPSPSPGVCSNSCPLNWWCHPTISSFVPPSPPALSLSQHWVFSNELSLYIRWPKYWRVSISPSNEYSGLSSFRIDWFDLAVQETLQSLLQHHSFHIHTWLLEKMWLWLYRPLLAKWYLCFLIRCLGLL